MSPRCQNLEPSIPLIPFRFRVASVRKTEKTKKKLRSRFIILARTTTWTLLDHHWRNQKTIFHNLPYPILSHRPCMAWVTHGLGLLVLGSILWVPYCGSGLFIVTWLKRNKALKPCLDCASALRFRPQLSKNRPQCLFFGTIGHRARSLRGTAS